MGNLFAIVVMAVGGLFIVMGLSGNYAALPAALGIQLPAVEQAGPTRDRIARGLV